MKRSVLRSHNLFLDSNNKLIRLFTRLNNSQSSYERYNSILPAKCNETAQNFQFGYVREKYFRASRSFVSLYFTNMYHFVGGQINVVK